MDKKEMDEGTCWESVFQIEIILSQQFILLLDLTTCSLSPHPFKECAGVRSHLK